ncbi:hypothetical protein CASFOL_031929 [Castilleja foliolosa]|uniref:Uncharacterized protein n=1 Tax=Castilleja foliolosa TaxID=1961234 RepID=A0ABD3C007_9LAMI
MVGTVLYPNHVGVRSGSVDATKAELNRMVYLFRESSSISSPSRCQQSQPSPDTPPLRGYFWPRA